MEDTQSANNAAVLQYLRKMGYRQTERFFREEAHVAGLETLAFEIRNEQDSNITNYLLFSSANPDVGGYDEAYDRLSKWIYESLDAFRDELVMVLYPLYVHCILDMISKGATTEAKNFFEKYKHDHLAAHEDELQRLSSINEVSQVRENPLAVAFKSNKYNVTMSAYSFQLLMNFLQDTCATANVLMLKIINQYINIRVLVSKPRGAGSAASPSTGPSSSTNSSIGGLTGASAEATNSMNKDKILWGVNIVEPAVETALQQRAKTETRLNEILQGPLAQLKRIYTQPSLNAPPSDRIPKPPVSAAETSAEIDRLRNLAKKASLSVTSLPSICFYTLQNSYDGVTGVSFNPTFTMMASGNHDSYIDIWSLNHEPLRAIRLSTELAAMDLSEFESLEPMREFDGSLSKRLIGHSGPVYSSKFLFPDGQRFMVSVSQDTTARLWSLDTFSCVVVYRGHTCAVWDVEAAPLGAGPYFVTGSADKTARLWSTEHVQPLRIFAGHLSDVNVVKFHPNGNYIFSGSADKTCRMWDIHSGACVRLLAMHSRAVSSLCISPDGRYLASGDLAGIIKIWDLVDGRLVRTITWKKPLNSRATSSAIYAMEFDRDGRILAVGGADQMIRVYDMMKILNASQEESALLLASYPTKQTPIFKVGFNYRNVLLAAGPFCPDEV